MSNTEAKKRITFSDLKESAEIFKFIKPYKISFIIGIVFLLLSSGTALLFPFVAGKLVDAATGKGNGFFKNINAIAISLTVVLILQSIFSYARIWFFAVVSEKSMADIRKQLYNKIIAMPMPFFEERRVGELVSRITSDVTQLQDTLSLTLAEFFRQIATLIVGISIILITSTKLTLMMLASYPLIVVVAFIFGRYIRKLSKQTQDALADANVIVDETFQAINVVKAFTNEHYESKRFAGGIDKVVDFALLAAKYRGAFISFVIFGLFGGIVLVLWYGSVLVSQGEMTIGDLTAFIIYTAFIGGSVGGMGEVYSKIQKTVGSSERLRDILNTEEEININEPVSQNISPLKGSVTFNNVKFEYPTRKDVTVLQHISFQIKEGEKVALVGPSGAGKSTIIQLLLRYYNINFGSILIDEKPIQDFNITYLRKNIGIVPQEVILFGGTIRENILYGKPNATESEIIEAATKANAIQFIQSFPEGFETLVGERGIKLSGGQKQRIAIARAILKNPKILILDEATSSLDAESELLVQQALDELMKNRTTIIIAHRLSTIRKVDNIFVIEKGQIIEQGNHQKLMENEQGLYKHLVQLQFQK
jgi:ABC transporter fused permease/ATP-binding protein